MRHRLVLLLVAVLLLRGWVGEAMAGQMLAQQLHSAGVHSVQVQPDCHEAAGPEVAVEAACGSCLQCDTCTLNALPAQLAPVDASFSHALGAPAVAAFASAEPLRGFKPPKA
jgi:hypothetical protein